MIADPAFNPPEKREKMVQLAFETFRTPAVFLARSPVLAAFSLGKSTTLVLDSGAYVACARVHGRPRSSAHSSRARVYFIAAASRASPPCTTATCSTRAYARP
jgi:hypothetical protein